MLASSIYYFENGLRRVKPYYFSFKTHVKSRWLNRTIIDIFTQELGQNPGIIKQEIMDELIYVITNQGKREDSRIIKGWERLKERKIQERDIICNCMHIHEPAVPNLEDSVGNIHQQIGLSFEVIHKDRDVLVINKPAGIPTHPTGNFRYNSISEIVKVELGLNRVWPCHRLDKGTSGVLILGITKDGGTKYLNIISRYRDRIQKEYIVRVRGKFPDDRVIVEEPIFELNTSGGYITPTNSRNMPWYSRTEFSKIRYSAKHDHSIVKCKPLTGRMHQIRIHLRNLGFPIANDKQYNPDLSTSKYRLNKYRNDLELELYSNLKRNVQFQDLMEREGKERECIDLPTMINFDYFEKPVQLLKNLHKEYADGVKNEWDMKCSTCRRELVYKNEADVLWLHAIRYMYNSGSEESSFNFETSLPAWAEI